VQADPDLQAEFADRVADRQRAADAAGRPVEPGEKPSPAVSTSVPRYRASWARTRA